MEEDDSDMNGDDHSEELPFDKDEEIKEPADIKNPSNGRANRRTVNVY
jgi:hypothetical protein